MRDLGVHPWLDDFADEIVVWCSLEAIDGETGRVDADLDPAK